MRCGLAVVVVMATMQSAEHMCTHARTHAQARARTHRQVQCSMRAMSISPKPMQISSPLSAQRLQTIHRSPIAPGALPSLARATHSAAAAAAMAARAFGAKGWSCIDLFMTFAIWRANNVYLRARHHTTYYAAHPVRCTHTRWPADTHTYARTRAHVVAAPIGTRNLYASTSTSIATRLGHRTRRSPATLIACK